MDTTLFRHGQEVYSKTLQMRVTFLRWDTAGMAMCVQPDGEQCTLLPDDLQAVDWNPGDILEREA